MNIKNFKNEMLAKANIFKNEKERLEKIFENGKKNGEEINNICDDIIINLNSEYLFDKKYIYDKVLLIQNIVRGEYNENDN